MSEPRVATITVGCRLSSDGETFTVLGIEAGRLRLRGAGGRMLLVHTATFLADPSTTIDGAGDGPVEALGPVLENLTAAQRAQLEVRLGHVCELLTGYASGSAASAAEGEPRKQFDPVAPLTGRYAAKAAEAGGRCGR